MKVIINITLEDRETFYEKLIKYYESRDMQELKEWIYNNCIDGINLNN